MAIAVTDNRTGDPDKLGTRTIAKRCGAIARMSIKTFETSGPSARENRHSDN
jgi:hypothetical protein